MCSYPKKQNSESKTAKTEEFSQPEKKTGLSCIDNSALVVLVGVIFTALALICMFGYSRYIKDPIHPNVVSIVIDVDTTGVISPKTRIETDKIIATFEAHEHLLKDKYEHILQQKEDIKDYFTWGGMLITIVLSIFGFFGFRSIQSIDERVINWVTPKASEKATQSAEQLINTRLKGYLDNADKQLDNSIKNQEEKITNFENKTAQSLEMTITGKINKQFATIRQDIKPAAVEAVGVVFNKTFADRITDIDANSQDIKQLQQDYTALRALCDEYEKRIGILELRKGQRPSPPLNVLSDKPSQEKGRKDRTNPDPFNKKIKN